MNEYDDDDLDVDDEDDEDSLNCFGMIKDNQAREVGTKIWTS